MRRYCFSLIAILILIACIGVQPTLPAPTPAPTLTATPAPFTSASATPASTATATLGITPSPTVIPIIAAVEYHDPTYNLTFEYPLRWVHVRGLEFQGPDGFMRITKLTDYVGKSVFHLCDDYILRTFPSDLSSIVQFPLGSGCMIYLKNPQPQDPVTWIFRYRYTLHDADFLLMQTNYDYFLTFINTGRFHSALTEKYRINQPNPHPRQIGRPPGTTIQEYFAGKVSSDGRGNFAGIELNPRGVLYTNQDPAPKCGKFLVIQDHIFSYEEDGRLINVKKDDQIIYATPVIGPQDMVQSFCDWNGHWALETQEFLFVDGQVLNHELNYDEIFGWRLISGRAFFFYRQQGFVHLSYDGKTLSIIYDNVPHYDCCAAGTVLDPHGNDSMVWFYGMRQGAWYYTEIRFNQ